MTIDVTEADINELCDLAKDAIGGQHPDDFKPLGEFVARMRESLIRLNKGHRTMYRVLQQMKDET